MDNNINSSGGCSRACFLSRAGSSRGTLRIIIPAPLSESITKTWRRARETGGLLQLAIGYIQKVPSVRNLQKHSERELYRETDIDRERERES